jgi:hypothetical protein
MLESRVRIRFRVKSLFRISINSGALEAQNGGMDGVDAHNGGVEVQNGAEEGL